MGTHDKLSVAQWSELRITGREIGVFAAPAQTATISAGRWPLSDLPVVVHGVSQWETIPSAMLANKALAIIEVDPSDPRSLNRLVEAIRTGAGIPVIAALDRTELALVRTLLREGVRDVVTLPFNLEELTQVALEALARDSARAPARRLAPMVAVVRSNGGCGATTVATHLVAALGKGSERGEPLLLDLDMQFGVAAQYLGVDGRGSILDLLGAVGRLDDTLLTSAANDLGGFSIIAAPAAMMPIEHVEIDALLQSLQCVRAHYGCTILDLPACWTNWSLSAASSADLIVLVTELTVNSLRQARRCIDLFDSIGIDPARVKIVVNRAEKRLFKPITVDDVAATLGREVIGSLSNDPATLSVAQERGVLAHQVSRKNRFSKDIELLGEVVSALLPRVEH